MSLGGKDTNWILCVCRKGDTVTEDSARVDPRPYWVEAKIKKGRGKFEWAEKRGKEKEVNGGERA